MVHMRLVQAGNSHGCGVDWTVWKMAWKCSRVDTMDSEQRRYSQEGGRRLAPTHARRPGTLTMVMVPSAWHNPPYL